MPPEAEQQKISKYRLWRSFRYILLINGLIYSAQLLFAVIQIIGLAGLFAADSWIGLLDFLNIIGNTGLEVFMIGLVGSYAIGLLMLIIAISIFFFSSIKILPTPASLVILFFCHIAYLIPILNIVPWMVIWSLYLVFKNSKLTEEPVL